jgi:hypothetical protein
MTQQAELRNRTKQFAYRIIPRKNLEGLIREAQELTAIFTATQNTARGHRAN